MILTVTLNAAIDRTVAVPNFRLGHRHRAVESRTVAGGKGINVARALRLLGRPVIATGFAGGPTGNRMLEQLRKEAILTDFTWIAGETRINMSVVDPDLRRADRDQRAWPGGQPGGGRALHRAAALPRRRGEDLRSRRHAAARGGIRALCPHGRGPARVRRHIDPRLRGGGDAGRPARRRLGRHPERARGGGAGRPGVRRRRRLRPRPHRAGPTGRWRSGDHAARRLRRRGRRGRRAVRARSPHQAAGAGLDGRFRRRFPGRLRRRALRRPRAGRVPRLRLSPAAPSRPSTSARARSTAAGSSGCSTRSRCATWRSTRKCRLAVQRHHFLGGSIWRSISVEARRGGAPTDSMTSRSFRRAAPAIPTT